MKNELFISTENGLAMDLDVLYDIIKDSKPNATEEELEAIFDRVVNIYKGVNC